MQTNATALTRRPLVGFLEFFLTTRIEFLHKLRMNKTPLVGVVCILQFTRARFLKMIAALSLSGLLVAMPVAVRATTFTGGAITFNDGTTAPSPASQYPSSIAVSGLGSSLSSVTLTLTSFTRSARPDDLEMLLVGPTGASLIVFSDVGGTAATGPENLVLSDAASSFLPVNSLSAGTFKPANYSTTQDTFPAPAPSGPYGSAAPSGTNTFATEFSGTDPNGTWSLYIVDGTPNTGGETGSITGWSLNITASAVPEPGTWALLIAGTVALFFFAGRSHIGAASQDSRFRGRI